MAHRPDWVSVCYVFDDRIENINAVKNCDVADLKVYAIHGEHTQKGDTFTQNYIPALDENTLIIQIKNIVNTALKNTILNHESKVLSAIMPTTPLDKATSVVKKITDGNLSFNEQWQIILEHFSKIPLKFFGGFQLSFFDVELLRLLVINKVIFMKLDLLNKSALALTRWDISRPSDCQQLIEMMHQNNAAARKSSSAHNLHASADQMPRLPRLKTSEAISIEAFRRSANSGGTLRPRSFSEAPKPSDTADTTNEIKAPSLEKN